MLVGVSLSSLGGTAYEASSEIWIKFSDETYNEGVFNCERTLDATKLVMKDLEPDSRRAFGVGGMGEPQAKCRYDND